MSPCQLVFSAENLGDTSIFSSYTHITSGPILVATNIQRAVMTIRSSSTAVALFCNTLLSATLPCFTASELFQTFAFLNITSQQQAPPLAIGAAQYGAVIMDCVFSNLGSGVSQAVELRFGSQATIINTVFSDNQVTSLYATFAQVTITRSSFLRSVNTPAIVNIGSTVVMNNCTCSQNTGNQGGCSSILTGSTTVNGEAYESNSAQQVCSIGFKLHC